MTQYVVFTLTFIATYGTMVLKDGAYVARVSVPERDMRHFIFL